MKLTLQVFVVLIVTSLSGCADANLSRNREAYILSQPHGWVEITVSDEDVPADPPPKNLPPEKLEGWEPSPPACSLVVELNNEQFLYESIFPFGAAPPYVVDTGFRFPVPVGNFEISFEYRGCDVESNEITMKSFSTTISSAKDMVIPIFLDGESISIDAIKEDTVITLEDIFQKLNQ